MIGTGHISVMKDEVLEFFAPRYPGYFLDMTFGGGGHTRAILQGHPANRVLAVDCDPEAAARAQSLGAEFPGRLVFSDGFFDEVTLPKESFSGILFDLGVSSFQLDTPERGFSFRKDAPADMRMNPRTGMPAWQLIETSDHATLETIVRDFGEEPRWRQVVKVLEAAKGSQKIRTTLGLSEIIATQAKFSHKLHPATRVFMGLRMAVNDELGRLQRALPKAFEALAIEGILAVISFHSIEDRTVKIFFQGITRPKDSAPAKLLIKKVGRPEKSETQTNIRARSAKLRVLQKISNLSIS